MHATRFKANIICVLHHLPSQLSSAEKFVLSGNPESGAAKGTLCRRREPHSTWHAHLHHPHAVSAAHHGPRLQQPRHLAVQRSLDEAEIFQDRLRLLMMHSPSKATMIRAGTRFQCSLGKLRVFWKSLQNAQEAQAPLKCRRVYDLKFQSCSATKKLTPK